MSIVSASLSVSPYFLRSLANEKAKKGNINEARQIAHTIPDEAIKSFAFRDLTEIETQKGNFTKAVCIANQIPLNHTQSFAFRDLASVMAQKGFLSRAIKIASKIRITHTQSFAFRDLAEITTKKGDFVKAKEIANKIQDHHTRSFALNDIEEKLAKKSSNNVKTRVKKLTDRGNMCKTSAIGKEITIQQSTSQTEETRTCPLDPRKIVKWVKKTASRAFARIQRTERTAKGIDQITNRLAALNINKAITSNKTTCELLEKSG